MEIMKLTLRDILLESVNKWPERPALGAVGSESRTYTNLLEDAAAWASWLRTLGPEKGRSSRYAGRKQTRMGCRIFRHLGRRLCRRTDTA
jgi:acyl-CoA synthetase (AMP-forming)/AMP-acid ligase II